MGKTIDNILGKIERLIEVPIVGGIYARYFGIDIMRNRPKIKEGRVKDYEPSKLPSDYRK
jgi:hypothetical protein